MAVGNWKNIGATVESVEITDGEIVNADISDSAAIERSKLEQKTKAYPYPFWALRKIGDWAALLDAAASSDLGLDTGVYGTACWRLLTIEGAGADNEQGARFAFYLPPEYVAGEDFLVRIRCRVTAIPDKNRTIKIDLCVDDEDFTVTSLALEGGVQTVTTSFADYDWTVTGTGLNPGDLIEGNFELRYNDDGGSTSGRGEILRFEFRLPVKG